MEVGLLVPAGSATALITGLGAVPSFCSASERTACGHSSWGATVGLMSVASIVGVAFLVAPRTACPFATRT